jgi:hypothetical protein
MTHNRHWLRLPALVSTGSQRLRGGQRSSFPINRTLAAAFQLNPAELFATTYRARPGVFTEITANLANLSEGDLEWVGELSDTALARGSRQLAIMRARDCKTRTARNQLYLRSAAPGDQVRDVMRFAARRATFCGWRVARRKEPATEPTYVPAYLELDNLIQRSHDT